jgi:hypothetical protein
MAVYEPHEVIQRCSDGSWSVCAHERRLVFLNGDSAVEVPVEGPLRWCLNGVDMPFDRALGVALPVGYHEWPMLAARAEPVCAWMHALAAMDGIEPPSLPDGIDDGLSLDDDGYEMAER